MNEPAKFLPHNVQEFENDMRALIVKHMGLGQGNPTQWVVNAVCEAYQRGFGVGFGTGQSRAAFVAQEVERQNRTINQQLLGDPAMPMVERIKD